MSGELPDNCPECGGLAAAHVYEEREDGTPLRARMHCAGDSHIDDGSECGYQWRWWHESVDE